MALSDLLYAAYERRLSRRLATATLPRHVGVMLDGNRRWARARGHGTSEGHQAGADNIANLLEWCEEARVEVVTLWLLSTDNLNRAGRRGRAPAGDHRDRRGRPRRDRALADQPGGLPRPPPGGDRATPQGEPPTAPRASRG